MTSYGLKITAAVVGTILGAAVGGAFTFVAWFAPGGAAPLFLLAIVGFLICGGSLWFGGRTLSAEIEASADDHYRYQLEQRAAADRPRPPRPALPGEVDKLLREHGALLQEGVSVFTRMADNNTALLAASDGLAEYVEAINRDRSKLHEEVTRARHAIAVWNGQVQIERAAAPRREPGADAYGRRAPAFLRRDGANGAAGDDMEAELASLVARPAEPAEPVEPPEGERG